MWMKIDDGLHAHRKTRAVTKSHDGKRRDAAPMGLWVLAGSWAGQNGTDGWVPEDELDRWDEDWHSLAARLVKSGYWWPVERDGEPGYGFTDWHDYNDPADLASKAGSYGNHVRWHINEQRVDPDCEHCPKEPDDRGDVAPESGGDRGAMLYTPEFQGESASSQVRSGLSGGESGGESRKVSPPIALPEPDPNPTRPDPTPVTSAIAERRDDAERICEHLATRIETNGSKRPTITKGWRDAARLMLDRDGRTEQEIHGAIEWAQADEFWRANILSLPKLREKYDQLRLQAQRRSGSTSRNEEWREMQDRQMARAEEREREMGLR